MPDVPFGRAERRKLAGRHEVLGGIQNQRHAFASGRISFYLDALDDSAKAVKQGIRVMRPGRGVAQLACKVIHHALAALGVAASQGAESAGKVVMQDHVPRAEHLSGEKLRQVAVRVTVGRRGAKQIVDVSVQNEQAGRA